MNNFIPINFAEIFFQFIPIKIFKILCISIRFTWWWRLYKIFQNNKLNQIVRYWMNDITRYGSKFKTVEKNINYCFWFFCYSNGLKNKQQKKNVSAWYCKIERYQTYCPFSSHQYWSHPPENTICLLYLIFVKVE